MPEYAGMITESDEDENCYSILISRYCGYLKMTKLNQGRTWVWYESKPPKMI